MGKALIITEKPSVARDFARILGSFQKNEGFWENESYVITWCVGHLVEMVYPEEYDEKYKKWKLEDLPFLPREYKYHVIPEVSRQYDVVHGMLYRVTPLECTFRILTRSTGPGTPEKKGRPSKKISGISAASKRA